MSLLDSAPQQNMDSDILPGQKLMPSLTGKERMGEVYQAEDEMLGRQVSIEVRSEEFAWRQ